MQALLLSSSAALAPSAAAAQRQRRSTGTTAGRRTLLVQAEKGFSGGQGQKLPKNVKVRVRWCGKSFL